ncbi:MAG: primosomal protein N' [Alistipes sp.]|nr:primosomal protein N' [Alistipes sp.]
MGRYADIILPLAQSTYTYAVGEGIEVEPGDAVAVQFGTKAVYTGIVRQLHDNPPARGRTKSILARLYDKPLLSPLHLRFWEWLADYYMCSLGEVMRVALPSLIKPHAGCESEFEPYIPRRERVLRITNAESTALWLAANARRAPKRAALIEQIMAARGELPRTATDLPASALKAMAESGAIELGERDFRPVRDLSQLRLPQLSEAQHAALESIHRNFDDHDTVLLHGVTGSGKTEIYTHLIAEHLVRGEDVLYLVPEISLTTQLVERLQALFGECVTAYHSKLTPARRTRIFTDMLNAPSGNFIIGARSAIFLPYKKLGLVVIDEEHDPSYKQSEPNPRYNGRDAAIMLAALHKAKSLAGSATPSLESYANTLSGKYALVRLMERYGGSELPRIIISDTLRAAKRNERREQFNKVLIDKIDDCLERNEQVILFQNRRGYSPYIECTECGWTARCPHCNVSLTQHRHNNTMRCHYCGYSTPIPRLCPSCKVAEPQSMGFGTERVEDAVAKLFPQARTLRLDGDTATSGAAYNRIISAFARHEADILIGTQIVSKGLDFADVTLIGVLNGDNLLNAPDFRASERAWQLLQQIAGRSGRRDRQGEVVIQTAEPTHPLYGHLCEADYDAFAAQMLAERQMFSYPPYVRIINIALRSYHVESLVEASTALAASLRKRFGGRVIGPASPLIDRVRNEHRVEISLKIETSASFARARVILAEEVQRIRLNKCFGNVTIICDVDAW